MRNFLASWVFVMGLAVGVYASCVGPYCWTESGATIETGLLAPKHYVGGGVGGASASTMTASGIGGMLTADASYNLYVSTCSSGAACWVKVGGQ